MDQEKFEKKLDFMQYKIRNWLKGTRTSTAQELVNDLSIDVDILQECLDKKK